MSSQLQLVANGWGEGDAQCAAVAVAPGDALVDKGLFHWGRSVVFVFSCVVADDLSSPIDCNLNLSHARALLFGASRQ